MRFSRHAESRKTNCWTNLGKRAAAAGTPGLIRLRNDHSRREHTVRAVLGRKVREILKTHFDRVRFFAPDTAFAEAREHLPGILLRRGISPKIALGVLAELPALVGCIASEIFGPFEAVACQRLHKRDEEDWTVLASALALKCPIWTEDTDFFGTGVATWTTDKIELLLTRNEPGLRARQDPSHERKQR